MKIPRLFASFAVTLVTTSGLTMVTDVAAPAAAEAAVVKKRLVGMVKSLKVAREVRFGYDRDLFNHWVDADGDGDDTRREVVIQEARVKPQAAAGCDLLGGRWVSYSDGPAPATTPPSMSTTWCRWPRRGTSGGDGTARIQQWCSRNVAS